MPAASPRPARPARPVRSTASASSSAGHLLLYLLLAHGVLLAHQYLYWGHTAPETARLAAAGRRLAEGTAAGVGGAPAEGYLSVLTTGVAAAAVRFGFEPILALKLAAAAAGHGLLLALFLATSGSAPNRPFWTRILAPAALAFAPVLALASSDGREWALYACFLLAAATRFASREAQIGWVAALAFVAAALARREGLVIAAVALLWHFAAAASAGALGRLPSWLGPFILVVLLGGVFALRLLQPPVAIPDLLAGSVPGWEQGRILAASAGLSWFSDVYLLDLVLPIAICLAVMWRWPLSQVSFLAAAASAALVVYSGGDGSPGQVALLPVLAFLALLAQEGYAWIVNRMFAPGATERRMALIMGAVPLLLYASYAHQSVALLARLELGPAIGPASGAAGPAASPGAPAAAAMPDGSDAAATSATPGAAGSPAPGVATAPDAAATPAASPATAPAPVPPAGG